MSIIYALLKPLALPSPTLLPIHTSYLLSAYKQVQVPPILHLNTHTLSFYLQYSFYFGIILDVQKSCKKFFIYLPWQVSPFSQMIVLFVICQNFGILL